MISLREDGHVNEVAAAPLVRISSEAAVMAVRSALQAQLQNRASSGELRRAIRLMTREARRKDLKAEQLLIVFKRAWHSLPVVDQLPYGPDRADLLSRIITMCIEEFYTDEDRH